ncbi:hypothetical protein [Devosia sp. SL43]|nr:hypothetical protein [Devosia sp. SL43]UJW84634.1 hypothetical protein IM737_14540 [Devosia sp. SL43]
MQFEGAERVVAALFTVALLTPASPSRTLGQIGRPMAARTGDQMLADCPA